MVVRKIVRNGNSLCVNIPMTYLHYLEVKKGSEVYVIVGIHELQIRKRSKSDGKNPGKEIDKNG